MTRRRSVALLAIVLGAAVVSHASVTRAETLRVRTETATGPHSLGRTILDAGKGDTIEIPPGEYLLTEGDALVAQGNVLEDVGEGVVTIVPSGGGEALADPAVRVSETIEIAPARQAGVQGGGGGGQVDTKAQIIALIATFAIFGLVLEMVRRRRLAERYALLWMFAAFALLVLAIWTDGLDALADVMGIEEPANAIFILAFGVAFGLLLSFSAGISRLSEETKILAQEVARLELDVRNIGGDTLSGNTASQRQRQEPVRRRASNS